LLLAAVILATEIGKLAAIAVLRKALNYFLERELESIEGKLTEKPKEAMKSK